MGLLNRMTQWKVFHCIEFANEKTKLEQVQSKGLIPRPENDDDTFGGARLGLFTYPVLQAADILLYKFGVLWVLILILVQHMFPSETIKLSIWKQLAQ